MNPRPRTPVAIVLILFLLGSYAAAEEAPTLRAGAATANITPWLGLSLNGGMSDRATSYIHDELHARAIALESGGERLVIVVADSCMIPREICDAAKAEVRERTGIPPESVLIAATHAHSCGTATGVFQSDPDPQYQQFVTRRLVEAVVRAVQHVEPARVGHGVGSVPHQVFNRRWWLKPGTMPPNPWGSRDDQVKMNPRRASPDLVRPAGPIDPAVWVLSLETTGGRPLALLANYSLHYVGGTGGGHVSADYFGMFAALAEAELGAPVADSAGGHPPFVAILSNGTSGDINNIDFRKPGVRREPYEQMRLVAGDVAREALAVYGGTERRSAVRLGSASTTLSLGVRRPSDPEVAEAKRILAAATGRHLRGLAEIYARETVLLAEYPREVELVLSAFRIGDLAICAIPCEVFVEIGLELRARSPFPATFTIELANGYNGYLPTPKQHELGGYETWRARSSYLEEGASPKIVEAVLGLLASLRADEAE